MAELSDIEPVNQRFFSSILSNEDLSLTAKRRLVDTALQGRLELEKARSGITRNRQQERLNQLRLEEDDFRLSESRIAAEKKRETVQEVGLISETIKGIHNSPLSPQRKLQEYANLRVNKPDLFAASDAARGQIKAAEDSLPKPMTSAEKRYGEAHQAATLKGERAQRKAEIDRSLLPLVQEEEDLERLRGQIESAKTPYTPAQLREAIEKDYPTDDVDEYATKESRYPIERYVRENQQWAESQKLAGKGTSREWKGPWDKYVRSLGFEELQALASEMAYSRLETVSDEITQARRTLRPGAPAASTAPRGNPMGIPE